MDDTPWKSDIAPENIPSQKERIVFQSLFFKGYAYLPGRYPFRSVFFQVWIFDCMWYMYIPLCSTLIPSASGFGGGFGRLNSFSQGIRSTRDLQPACMSHQGYSPKKWMPKCWVVFFLKLVGPFGYRRFFEHVTFGIYTATVPQQDPTWGTLLEGLVGEDLPEQNVWRFPCLQRWNLKQLPSPKLT